MIFSGNPGTGKLTVAKMIGEIYQAIGVLEKQEVVVQNGRSFAAETGLAPQQVVAALLEAAVEVFCISRKRMCCRSTNTVWLCWNCCFP